MRKLSSRWPLESASTSNWRAVGVPAGLETGGQGLSLCRAGGVLPPIILVTCAVFCKWLIRLEFSPHGHFAPRRPVDASGCHARKNRRPVACLGPHGTRQTDTLEIQIRNTPIWQFILQGCNCQRIKANMWMLAILFQTLERWLMSPLWVRNKLPAPILPAPAAIVVMAKLQIFRPAPIHPPLLPLLR